MNEHALAHVMNPTSTKPQFTDVNVNVSTPDAALAETNMPLSMQFTSVCRAHAYKCYIMGYHFMRHKPWDNQ